MRAYACIRISKCMTKFAEKTHTECGLHITGIRYNWNEFGRKICVDVSLAMHLIYIYMKEYYQWGFEPLCVHCVHLLFIFIELSAQERTWKSVFKKRKEKENWKLDKELELDQLNK